MVLLMKVNHLERELEEIKRRLPPQASLQTDSSRWQLYFRPPFANRNAVCLVFKCVQKALAQKVLDKKDLCKVELVCDREWKAIRLSAARVSGVPFRKLASDLIKDNEPNNESVTTR